MRLVALFLLLLFSGCVATAASDPCAKYADADAYNYCLAGSGPLARHRPSAKATGREPSRAPRRVSRPAPDARPSGKPFPTGMIQKPAPRGRVRFQIMVR